MLKDIKVTSPEKAWARGRNGVFQPKTVTVMDNHQSGNERCLSIFVESKRAGNNSPIHFRLGQYDAEQLACAILGISESTAHRVQVPEGEEIALACWCVDDVYWKAREMGRCITLEQANEVLMNIEDNQDCNYGISWYSLENEIDNLREDLPMCIHEDDENVFSCYECEKYKVKETEPCTA